MSSVYNSRLINKATTPNSIDLPSADEVMDKYEFEITSSAFAKQYAESDDLNKQFLLRSLNQAVVYGFSADEQSKSFTGTIATDYVTSSLKDLTYISRPTYNQLLKNVVNTISNLMISDGSTYQTLTACYGLTLQDILNMPMSNWVTIRDMLFVKQNRLLAEREAIAKNINKDFNGGR